MISFKEWILIKEGGKGSGTKLSATGLRAGGQAQAGIGMYKPAKPKIAIHKPIHFNK
jgi:hypothetical protein